jgi:uncharacterized membrane protein
LKTLSGIIENISNTIFTFAGPKNASFHSLFDIWLQRENHLPIRFLLTIGGFSRTTSESGRPADNQSLFDKGNCARVSFYGSLIENTSQFECARIVIANQAFAILCCIGVVQAQVRPIRIEGRQRLRDSQATNGDTTENPVQNREESCPPGFVFGVGSPRKDRLMNTSALFLAYNCHTITSMWTFDMAPEPASTAESELYPHKRTCRLPVDVNSLHYQKLNVHDRLAMLVTGAVGSMYAVYLFLLMSLGWMLWQQFMQHKAFDPYPFAFLFLAGNLVQLILMPLIMVGQNIQSRHSELRAQEEYETCVVAYQDIEDIIEHLNAQDEELVKQSKMLEKVLERLEERITVYTPEEHPEKAHSH